jgi:hypothetical protein
MRFIPLMVVLTLLISAFATEPKEKVEASSSGTSECTKAGGVLKKIGMAQTEVCAIPYSDAGKRCSDKADCLGVCVASYADGDGKATSGTC